MKNALIIFTLLAHISFAQSASDCERFKNHPAYEIEYRECMQEKKAKEDPDCINCAPEKEATGSGNGMATLEVLAQPLGMILSAVTAAKFERKTQKAWVKAYESGLEQCNTRYNSFLNYNTLIGANVVDPTQAQGLSSACNGFGYGAYAGFGGLASNGFGGVNNPFLASGLTSGFLQGYGGYNLQAGSINDSGMLAGGMGVNGLNTSVLPSNNTGLGFGF